MVEFVAIPFPERIQDRVKALLWLSPRARGDITGWLGEAWNWDKDLKLARKLFMREHKAVCRVLASIQDAYYRSDDWSEQFVPLCHDVGVQKLAFEVYMNKKLVNMRPMAHIKIDIKNMTHFTGLVKANRV